MALELIPDADTCYVTMDALLNISDAQFSFPCNEGANTYLTVLLWELNESVN